MQAKIQESQERIQSIVIEGVAGAGMVKVKMDGLFRIRSVMIDPSLSGKDDLEMIGDLVTAAANDAHRQISETVKREMMQAAGGMSLPPGMFGA